MSPHATILKKMEDEVFKRILKQLSDIKTATLSDKKLLELTKKPLLDINDVAQLFNRRSQTIHLWRRKGIIEGIPINGRWFYTWEAIAETLNRKH
jgi:hypothetical protein